MKTSLKSEVKSLKSAINDVNSKLLVNYSVDLINTRQLLEWHLAAKSQKLNVDDLENPKKNRMEIG